ncbi:hypothetical protein AI29_15040 [bacteria symbiont BFo2 of Frankliniella occidentalis]|nr:hypothetical protein AI29_15040 [bacteria symbiont BFo2 of Frankliniella occidentalis]KYP93556.1 hypothetical protein WB67_13095 [bacteria symbiont BFo2 of Frankliniella occidentalis]
MNKSVKERGIIFNGEMVRAILDGRKTQTRRVLKAQPSSGVRSSSFVNSGFEDGHGNEIKCPFGQVGDRLWVRETFRVHSRATDVATLAYKASEQQSWTQQVARVPIELCTKQVSPEAWTPSIHMPRWASRITLEITDIRVERLNDISEKDAAAEGVGSATWFAAKGVPEDEWTSLGEFGAQKPSHINCFASLWESIYGQDSWQSNPFVWVVEFKRVEAA